MAMAEKSAAFAIENEREQFTKLLAVNPNHFGNLATSKLSAVLQMSGNVKYEEITCVGYNPDLDRLEAVVQIKLSFGYKGDLCSPGSTEFIRFFVDYGSGWTDAGVASFKVHDIPDGTDCAQAHTKPLSYAVSLPFQPQRDRCQHPVLPKVRAILSWEVMPPPDPYWPPVWGNVLPDRHIQIKPRPRLLLELATEIATVFDSKVKLPPGLEYLSQTPIDVPPPPPPTIETLAKLYSQPRGGLAVEPHRFAVSDIAATLGTSFVSDAAVAEAKLGQYKSMGLDWASIVATLEKTQGSVRYEQLNCVGLDYNLEWVVANFVIKRPTGYGGTLCEHGSVEHVAFWVDWDNTCEWTYLATVGVRVHDIASIPSDGLHYWVGVPARLGAHRRSCKEPKIGRLRAVLSWNTPPSTTDPEAPVHWGNRVDTHVEIKPGRPLSEHPAIDVIGGVSVAYISVGGDGMTVANALFAATGAFTDPWVASRRCAFGGDIYVNAEVPESFSAAGYKYCLRVRKVGTFGDGDPVTSLFAVTRTLALGGGTSWVTPDPATGWVSYLHPDQNIFSVLGRWQSRSLGSPDRNAQWEIKLFLASSTFTVLGETSWHHIQLDNEAPVGSIQIDSGGMVLDCHDFDQGTLVTGHFVAYDPNGHFGAWSLDTTPNSLNPPDPVATPALASTSPTGFAGHDWQLDTATNTLGGPLQPCGYVLTVRIWDNTIVDSYQGIHNYFEDDTGFCLRAK